MSKPVNKLAITLLFIGAAVAMGLAGVFHILSSIEEDRRATFIPIDAKVVYYTSKVSTDSDGDTTVTYSPVFEYTVDQKVYRSSSSGSSSSRPYEIGQIVQIKYNPLAPNEILAPGDPNPFGILLALMLVITACVCIAGITNILPNRHDAMAIMVFGFFAFFSSFFAYIILAVRQSLGADFWIPAIIVGLFLFIGYTGLIASTVNYIRNYNKK